MPIRAGSPSAPDPLLIAALICSIPFVVWVILASLGSGPEVVEFQILATSFVLLAIGYIALNLSGNIPWASIPFLLTVEMIATMVFIPIWRFALNEDRIDREYVRSILIVLIGFVAFWLASLATKRGQGLRFVPATQTTSPRVAFAAVGMFTLGTGTDLFLWRMGLYGYIADQGLKAEQASALQWLSTASNLLLVAIVVSAIEVFGKSKPGLLIRVVFLSSFTCAVAFGVISGMKANIVGPFLILVIAMGITKQRIPKTALALPVIVLAVVYPFIDAYRDNIQGGYGAQSNSLSGLSSVITQSIYDAYFRFGATHDTKRYSAESRYRMAQLSYVRDVVGLPAPSLLNGDEKLWMAPIYPFIPRFLWKDKPIFDKGSRLSIALGRPAISSSAITPVADLYLLYGITGVILGMAVLGAGLQLIMNWLGKAPITEAGAFVYILLPAAVDHFEPDATKYIVDAVQFVVIVLVLAYLIYGRSAFRLLSRQRVRPA